MDIIYPLSGFAVSYVLTYIAYPRWIAFLHARNITQTTSEYALQEYQQKQKTPMFGGVLFVLIPTIMTIFIYNITIEPTTMLTLFLFLGFFMLGVIDDQKIAKEGKNDGLPVKLRVFVQVGLALFFMIASLTLITSTIAIPLPLVGTFFLTLPLFVYVMFGIFVIVASVNSVNITDGMDGLAAGVSLLIMSGLTIISHVYQQPQMTMLGSTLVGSLLAYLKYNMFPAKIFMGDGGSLALGGIMAAYAFLLKVEVAFVFLAGVLIWETGCVVIQQISVRVFKKRVFAYTPIHYSFTLAGWKEKSIVQFIWLLGLIFLILGLWSALWV